MAQNIVAIIVIPSTVTYNNKTYKVAGIGIYAFRDCSRLTSIYLMGKTPPSARGLSEYSYANATLYVPKGTMAIYKAAEGWKFFPKIVDFDAKSTFVNG